MCDFYHGTGLAYMSDELFDNPDNLANIPITGRKTTDKSKKSLGGRPAFNDKAHALFTAQPIEKKAEILKRQWANIGYILLCQGERFAQSVTKKDYGRLMQLLSSAGIAYDKVVPKGEMLGSLTFNLFKGLDHSAVSTVLGQTQSLPAPTVYNASSIPVETPSGNSVVDLGSHP